MSLKIVRNNILEMKVDAIVNPTDYRLSGSGSIDKKIHDNNSKKMMNIISTLLVISIVAWMVAYLFIRDLDPKLEIIYLISLTLFARYCKI